MALEQRNIDPEAEYAAICKGVRVPPSPFLNEARIRRIETAKYEGDEIRGALSVVTSRDRVLELGAGLGIVGAVIAKNAQPAALMSFEANPNLVPHIKALHALNGLEDKIELRNEVLISDPERPDTLSFHLRTSFLGSSLIKDAQRQSTAVDVATAAYDAVIRAFRPTVLVMDIEGGELDFLRHADLSTIRAIVIEFHPGTYGIAGMRACKDVLRAAGFTRHAEVSTRTVWTCSRDPATAHAPVASPLLPPDPAGGLSEDIEVFDNAIVAPKIGNDLDSPGGVQTADGAHPSIAVHWRKTRALTTPFETPTGKLKELKGRYLWGGMLYRTFAHFVAESVGRLWALSADIGPIDGIVFVTRRPIAQGRAVRRYHGPLLEAMGVKVPIHVIEVPTRIEELVVPGQGFGLGKISAGTSRFKAHIKNHFAQDVKPDGPERLYISRSRLVAGRGGLLGESEIETHLKAEGYAVFHPQAHDIPTQISRYKAAQKIIACDGSALHLAGFCTHPDQTLAMICRRKSSASTLISHQLASFAENPPLVIQALRRQWQPTKSKRKRLFVGEPDMAALHAALLGGGFIENIAPWGPLPLSFAKAIEKDGYTPVG